MSPVTSKASTPSLLAAPRTAASARSLPCTSPSSARRKNAPLGVFRGDHHHISAKSAGSERAIEAIQDFCHSRSFQVVLEHDSPAMRDRAEGRIGDVVEVLQEEQLERIESGLIPDSKAGFLQCDAKRIEVEVVEVVG